MPNGVVERRPRDRWPAAHACERATATEHCTNGTTSWIVLHHTHFELARAGGSKQFRYPMTVMMMTAKAARGSSNIPLNDCRR